MKVTRWGPQDELVVPSVGPSEAHFFLLWRLLNSRRSVGAISAKGTRRTALRRRSVFWHDGELPRPKRIFILRCSRWAAQKLLAMRMSVEKLKSNLPCMKADGE